MKNYFYNVMLIILFLSSVLISCDKDEETPVVKETGTVTDIENNVYNTIKIGDQWWMAENLRVKTFRNGQSISKNQTNETWVDSTSAYCVFDNNENSPGLLYNWSAVTDNNQLAPTGWHIATDAEWKKLEQFLGMISPDSDKNGWRGSNEADKLRIEGTNGWTAYSGIWSTNESGFTALAGGCRLFNGTWGDPGLFASGYWWSSTSYSGKEAWYRNLDYKNSKVYRSYCDKNYGMSVRCVKD